MTGKVHIRLAVLAALAALAAVLVPAGLAAGSHEEDSVLTGDASYVLLTLGNKDHVTWTGDTTLTQEINTKKNDCLAVDFEEEPDLLGVGASGGELGEVKDGLGVQGPSDGSGEPCGRVEDSEAIAVSLGTFLDDDFLMTAVDVDLELKFEAAVIVTYFHNDEKVAEDRFAPMEKADDGPDSKDGDNYRYHNRPLDSNGQQIHFDEVKFAPESGSFSLEGGADGTDNGSLFDKSNASQFEVVETFDGEISCGDEVTIESGVDVSGVVTMHSLLDDMDDPEATWNSGCTLLKLYNDDVTNASLFFEPELENTSARYTLVYTAIDQAVTTESNGQISSLKMTYDPTPPFELTESVPLQACEGQPVLDSDDPGYDGFWEQTDVGLLPEGEFACFYSATVTTTGEDTGDEVWGIYFEDDPGWFS